MMAQEPRSALAKKLNLKPGMKIHVIDKPVDVDLGQLPLSDSADAEAMMVFVRRTADVDDRGGPVVDAARNDRIAWVAYPKAGQLGTDLNRDLLWRHMLGKGVEAVRQVAIDSVWSAVRFRPGKK